MSDFRSTHITRRYQGDRCSSKAHLDRVGRWHNGYMFLGENLLMWIILALGGALFAGNLMAIVKPPPAPQQKGDLSRAPLARSLFMAGLGLVAAIWALASLISN